MRCSLSVRDESEQPIVDQDLRRLAAVLAVLTPYSTGEGQW